MKSFHVNEKTKLSKFLLSEYNGGLSFATFNKLLRKKDIKVNGKRVSCDVILYPEDNIDVYYDGLSVETKIDIVYEDDNVLVVIKPKGITSEDFYNKLSHLKNLYFCHRLDRNTDGVMIFAKNQSSYAEIVDGFKYRTFDKYYRAKVYGVPKQKEETISAYLFKDSKNSVVKITDKFTKGSYKIETYYKLVDTDGVTSDLEVKLITGKTHQIRAHLAHIGHFILGDNKYGDVKISKSLGVKDLSLSAVKLVLHFPVGNFLYYLDGKTFVYR